MNRGRGRRIAGFVAGTLLFIACAGGGCYAGLVLAVLAAFADDDVHTRSFDAALWNHPDWESSGGRETSFHSIRQRMVDDLLAQHLRPGMDEAAVLALIGPPDEDPYFRRQDDPDAWVYWLGLERGFISIDSEWLFVSLDADRVLRRAYLARD
jgi:hypothetical protein